ncbi:hypothetical protein [Actinopolymorpha cephalotaxi]|uniref:Uncharacterized protein n=1 Tax=Actinopolymorpha cephalotaxi TaxID=504797 RepID=A0ABX2S5L0_9ACTN|nr:hypothetical protein [Actinopolymorpha cephalotaxi]NYH84328.1 hypothetical protein [Actinopolymorpha cephalotaxi]
MESNVEERNEVIGRSAEVSSAGTVVGSGATDPRAGGRVHRRRVDRVTFLCAGNVAGVVVRVATAVLVRWEVPMSSTFRILIRR